MTPVTNIMGAHYRELGIGIAEESRDYWVQDFGGCLPDPRSPVVASNHAFIEDGLTSFLLSYFDSAGGTPRYIKVVLDNVVYFLELDTGSGAAGTYRADVAGGTGCQSYYFLTTASDGTYYRYPGSSEFYTYGEGDCNLDYPSIPQFFDLQLL